MSIFTDSEISFPCPLCGETVSFNSERRGLADLCPACGEIITIQNESTGKKPPALSSKNTQEIEKELDSLQTQTRKPLQGLVTLLLSVVAFIACGLLQFSLSSLLIVMLVLLIHECGHYLGMKYFGYRDLQMLFIPFMGAAVTSTRASSKGLHQAIVSLLGPLPGIVLGIISVILYFNTKQDIYARFGETSLIINAFNLLPFYPLDGGKFLQAVLFSRRPMVELLFKLLAILALAYMAFSLRSVLLGIIAFFGLISLPSTHMQGKAAKRLRAHMQNGEGSDEERIPRQYLELILPDLRRLLRNTSNPQRMIAQHAQMIWQGARQTPPSARATILLMILYVGALGIVIGPPIVLAVSSHVLPRGSMHQQARTNGTAQWQQANATNLYTSMYSDEKLRDATSTNCTISYRTNYSF